MSLLNKTKGNIFFVKKIVYRHFKFFFFLNKFLRKSISQNIQNRWEKKNWEVLKKTKAKEENQKKKDRHQRRERQTMCILHIGSLIHRWEAFFSPVFSLIWGEHILVGLERKHPHSTNFPFSLLSNQTPTKIIFSPSFSIPLKSPQPNWPLVVF